MNETQIIRHKKLQHKWTETNYNTGLSLVAFYDIRPGNGAGLGYFQRKR